MKAKNDTHNESIMLNLKNHNENSIPNKNDDIKLKRVTCQFLFNNDIVFIY